MSPVWVGVSINEPVCASVRRTPFVLFARLVTGLCSHRCVSLHTFITVDESCSRRSTIYIRMCQRSEADIQAGLVRANTKHQLWLGFFLVPMPVCDSRRNTSSTSSSSKLNKSGQVRSSTCFESIIVYLYNDDCHCIVKHR
jgi:hypothetical protein